MRTTVNHAARILAQIDRLIVGEGLQIDVMAGQNNSGNARVAERTEIANPHEAGLFYDENVVRYRFACQFVAGRRVIDIACGNGYGTEILASAGGASAVVGVDKWLSMARPQPLHRSIDFVAAEAGYLPFQKESFDAAVCLETIEHLQKPQNFLQQLREAIVPDGLAVISTPLNNLESRVCPDNPYHVREYSAEEFESLISETFGRCDRWSQITDYADDLSLGGVERLRGVSWLRRIIHAMTPADFRRRARRALGSKGMQPNGSRIVPGISELAHVQIAVCRRVSTGTVNRTL